MNNIKKVSRDALSDLFVTSKRSNALSDMSSVYVENNQVICKTVRGSVVRRCFTFQDIFDVIMTQIEIQFNIYQFYVSCKGMKDYGLYGLNETVQSVINYSKSDFSPLKYDSLLSVYDKAIVVSDTDSISVTVQFRNNSSIRESVGAFSELLKQSRLNKVITSFTRNVESCVSEEFGDYLFVLTSDESPYQPDDDELQFIEFVSSQLRIAPYLMFICPGLTKSNMRNDTVWKALQMFFRVHFSSFTSDFVSQYAIISKK